MHQNWVNTHGSRPGWVWPPWPIAHVHTPFSQCRGFGNNWKRCINLSLVSARFPSRLWTIMTGFGLKLIWAVPSQGEPLGDCRCARSQAHTHIMLCSSSPPAFVCAVYLFVWVCWPAAEWIMTDVLCALIIFLSQTDGAACVYWISRATSQKCHKGGAVVRACVVKNLRAYAPIPTAIARNLWTEHGRIHFTLWYGFWT